MVLGVVTTAANTLRLLALSMLPASIFVVASSSDIVFNILFSRLFLKKRFGAWHYTAAVLATVGMSIVAAGSKPSSACHAPPCHSSLLPGLACTVVAAALVAANAVLAECVLKDQKVPGMFGALELAMFYSIVPSVLTPILVMATGEWKQWGPVLGNVGLHGSTAAFAMVCSGAVMSKLVSRTGRFVVIREKSAFFFAMLNSAVRLATAMAAYVGEGCLTLSSLHAAGNCFAQPVCTPVQCNPLVPRGSPRALQFWAKLSAGPRGRQWQSSGWHWPPTFAETSSRSRLLSRTAQNFAERCSGSLRRSKWCLRTGRPQRRRRAGLARAGGAAQRTRSSWSRTTFWRL